MTKKPPKSAAKKPPKAKGPPNLAAAGAASTTKPLPPAPPMVARKQTTIPGTQPSGNASVDAAAFTARSKSLALNKARKEQTDTRAYLFALMEQEGVNEVEGIGDDNRRFGFRLKDGKKVLEEYTVDEAG